METQLSGFDRKIEELRHIQEGQFGGIISGVVSGVVENISSHPDIPVKYQHDLQKNIEDYENALGRCSPPDHENEMINVARKKQAENCNLIHDRSVRAIMARMEAFLDDWGDNDKGRKILSMED